MAPSANCPTCRAALQLTNHAHFDSWVCPAGHGLAATLSELYERAQEDEIHALWTQAKAADPAGGRPCPMCERPMVSIAVGTDADEVDEGQPGDGAATGEVPVEVCVADQVIWFDAGELDAFPADLPDPEPTPEQEAALARITSEWGAALVAAEDARPGLADRLIGRLKRSPSATAAVAAPTAHAEA